MRNANISVFVTCPLSDKQRPNMNTMLDKYFDKNKTFRPKKKFEPGALFLVLSLSCSFLYADVMGRRIAAPSAAQEGQGISRGGSADPRVGQASAQR